MKAQSMTGQKKNYPGAGTSRHRASASSAIMCGLRQGLKAALTSHHLTTPARAAKAAGMTTAHATCAFNFAALSIV